MFSKAEIKLAPKVHKVLKELGYKWRPEEGEWGLTDYGEAVLIYRNIDEKTKENCPLLANTETYGVTACIGPGYHEVGIPILHWERIKKIVELDPECHFHIEIKQRAMVQLKYSFLNELDYDMCDTCQEAVMRQLIKYGEICSTWRD